MKENGNIPECIYACKELPSLALQGHSPLSFQVLPEQLISMLESLGISFAVTHSFSKLLETIQDMLINQVDGVGNGILATERGDPQPSR